VWHFLWSHCRSLNTLTLEGYSSTMEAQSWLDEQTEDITRRIKYYNTWRKTVGDAVN
jgi:hypothetical protein